MGRAALAQSDLSKLPEELALGAAPTAGRARAHRAPLAFVGCLLELTKPTITLTCLVMAGAGIWIAPAALSPWKVLLTLLGTALAVGSANALNMYIERDLDALMARTRRRPLPSGRLSPKPALWFGIITGVAAIFLLSASINALTADLAALAILSYVLVYTPLKRVTHWALVIGALPGAMPPLMGWTAATDQLGAGGLILFGVLLCWQLPHFIAITLYRRADYARAGFKVLLDVRGTKVARRHAFIYTITLVVLSLLLVPFGNAGWIYFSLALGLGAWLLRLSLLMLTDDEAHSARRYFLGTILYLPVLVVALVIDAGLVSAFGS